MYEKTCGCTGASSLRANPATGSGPSSAIFPGPGVVGLYAESGGADPYGESGGSFWGDLGDTVLGWVEGWLGGQARRGGDDPCCPPGYDPPGVWPINSWVEGAPPDYRTPGAPLENPSPSGEGRLKDDFCDCIPIMVNGRLWALGEVRDGKVYPGTPVDRSQGVWVELNRQGVPILVPGVGSVPGPAGTAGGGSGGSGGGFGDGREANVGPALALALLGAGLYAARKRRG